ncbi:hypothetical protein AAD018_012145 [Aestuariibius insulae]|uniref:hypothetical protein n=1 Tax=Aestuariibius insulae TaxID=2058287 RepID=UPI00345E6F71
MKTTANTLSALPILPASIGPIDLRITRDCEIFTLLTRSEGQDWEVIEQIIRPDLPLVLYVGLCVCRLR